MKEEKIDKIIDTILTILIDWLFIHLVLWGLLNVVSFKTVVGVWALKVFLKNIVNKGE